MVVAGGWLEQACPPAVIIPVRRLITNGSPVQVMITSKQLMTRRNDKLYVAHSATIARHCQRPRDIGRGGG